MDSHAGPRREPPPDAPPAGSLSEDAARFLAAVQAELRDVRRELRLFAQARWARTTLALKESALGVLAGLVALSVVFTIAIVGALAFARGVFHGLLAWTESLWLAEALQGLVLLTLAFAGFALVRWNLGRVAVQRLERSRATADQPPRTPNTEPTRGAL